MKATAMALTVVLATLWGAPTLANQGMPSDPKARMQLAAQTNTALAVGYLREGKLAVARDTIDKALKEYPNTAETQMAAGLVYEQLGEQDRARGHYEKALRLAKDDNPDVLNNVAVYYCRTGERKRGEELFLKAAASPLYQTPEIAYTNAGRCAREDGRLNEAEQYFRKALAIRPKLPDPLLQMAEMDHAAGKDLPARAFLQRYFAVGPATPASLLLGYKIEMAMGDSAQAAEYARRLKSEFPNAEETGQLLGAEHGTP